MASALYYSPFIPTFNSNGLPVAGASLTFYYTGTTTLAPIYAGSGLTTPLANPVVANAAAKYPNIYLDDAIIYRVRTKNAAGVQIGDDADPYIPGTAINGGVGPPGGNVLSVGAFSIFGTLTIAAGTDLVQTTGYDVVGTGAALYVDDALSDSALATAHPRFCKLSANGRYFRLVGDAVTVEQGGATGTAATNDQPAVQAAITYAVAVGIREVRFLKSAYELWCPVRTTAVGVFGTDGHPLVVAGDVALIGLIGREGGTTLTLKGPTGAASRVQTVIGNPWMGGGILYSGAAVTKILQKNLIFDGKLTYNYGDARVVDLTDKGLHVDIGYTANLVAIHVDDCEYRDFAGEVFYGAGSFTPGSSGVIRNLKVHGSPQCAYNFNIMESLTIVNLEAGNSYQPTELVGGPGRTFVGGRFYDGYSCSIFGGPSPTYPASYPYTWADRNDADEPPFINWQGTRFETITQVSLGSWQRGNIVAIDTAVFGNYLVGHLRDWDLSIESWCDRNNGYEAFNLQGPPTLTTQVTSAPGGIFYSKPSNLSVRVDCRRTALAAANSRAHASAVGLENGLIDQDSVRLTVTGTAIKVWRVNGTPVANYGVPLITAHEFVNVAGQPLGGTYDDISGTTSYKAAWAALTFFQSAAATRSVTMDMTYGYADGQEVTFLHGGGGTGDRILSFAKNGTGMKLAETRLLRNNGDFLTLRYVPLIGKWAEAAFSGTQLSGTATIDAASIANAAQGTIGTVTVTGAALGDIVTGVSVSIATGGLNVWGEVTAANTVTVYATNTTGGAIDLASATYTVEAMRP